MTETNRRQNKTDREKSEDADLDRALDAALAMYAAVEPRAGLEQRVLANLRTECAQGPDRAWWRWRLAAAAVVAAIVVVAAGLALRLVRQPKPLVNNPPSVTTPSPQNPETYKPETQLAKHEPDAVPPGRHVPVHDALPHSAQSGSAKSGRVAAAYPKLDQFPSPQPLSKQEKILADYIAENLQDAALMAEARMEVLRQIHEEEQREMSDGGADSQPQNSQH